MSIADDLRKAYDERKQIRNAYEQGYVEGMRDAVKHGHWVDDGKFKYKHGGTGHEAKELFGTEWWTMERRKCSVCYKVSLVDDSILYGYCPHCGAKMDEVTE